MTKLEKLHAILTEIGSVLVAFSGGVDSSLLLKVARDVLPRERVIAVTALSETYPDHELVTAKEVAGIIGVEQIIIETSELEIPGFKNNLPDRCYHCKKELFSKLQRLAEELNLSAVVDGTNADDSNDYRPGMKACRELGIRSPLQEAGLTKAEIRELSAAFKLPTWNLPSYACLASRFPYGAEITLTGLKRVDAGESWLRGLGLKQFRLRDHGSIARIEVQPDQFDLAFQQRENIVKGLRELGYQYISLDLEGYRTGSMNEILSDKSLTF